MKVAFVDTEGMEEEPRPAKAKTLASRYCSTTLQISHFPFLQEICAQNKNPPSEDP